MEVDDTMTLVNTVLVVFGLSCIAVLIVVGAVAWVHDSRAERADRRRAIDAAERAKQRIAAEQANEWM